MSLSQDTHWDPQQSDDDDEIKASVLMDLIMSDLGDSLSGLDDIEEPSPEDLAKLDDDFADEFELETEPTLAMLSALEKEALEEPELVSLEGLDELDETDELDDEQLDEVDDFLDHAADSYIDMDFDDDELDDEGYDLDDADEIDDYHDLYGDDDSIIPSFREGDLDDEDESGAAFYDDLR